MAFRRPAALVMVPVAVMVVLAVDVAWPVVLGLGRRIAGWTPLLPLRRRVAGLPGLAALPLFLVPELCSRGGTILSAWLLLHGEWWRALAVYVAAKLFAGGAALWIYTACAPALLRLRPVGMMHGLVAASRQAMLARLRHPSPFATLVGRIRESRSAWLAAGLAVAVAHSPARAADLLFQAEAQQLTGVCTGQPARLEGNHDTVVLSGTCGSLLVKGVADTVQLTVAAGGSIRVEGSGNRVRYAAAGAPPTVEILGPDNEVVQSGPPRPIPAPPPAAPAVHPAAAAAAKIGPVELAGDDQDRLADCAGHDVLVTGTRSSYIIRGACPSIVVRGDLLTVQAAVRSGARIAVTGRGSVVSWTLAGKGHPPVSVVRGAGSRVQRAEAPR